MGIYISLKAIFGPLVGFLLGNRFRLPARLFELRLASLFGHSTSERIVEYPWALSCLARRKNQKILDIGCGPQGLLASYLLSIGYDVYGLDVVDCISLQAERFLLRDARKTGLPESSFDMIILLSTLEHIGSDAEKDDLITIRESSRILRRGGLMILTTPFCAEYSNRGQRFYSKEKIRTLIDGFRILEERYYIQQRNKWVEVDLDNAETATRVYTGNDAVAIVALLLEKND